MLKKLLSLLIIFIFLSPITLLADDDDAPTPPPAPTRTEPRPGERNCPNDVDCDGIPDANDNCPQIFNPNQRNQANHPSLGDACNPDFQREFRASLRSQLDELLDNPTFQDLDPDNFGSCILDPSTNSAQSAFCKANTSIEKFNKLDQAFRNQLIVSVLEEPISNENIFNRAQVCSTRYLRDVNGGLQFTDGSANTNFNFDFDTAEGLGGQVDEYLASYKEELTGRKVAIAIDSCTISYVERCFPQFSYIREVNYSDPLPQIVSCSQVQLLFADSGADLLKQYVGLIYRWATGIVGVIAVLVIMINGIMISFAQGDDGKVSEAKGRIIQSLSALAILFLAGIILYSINPNFFTTENLQFQPSTTDFELSTETAETNDDEATSDDE